MSYNKTYFGMERNKKLSNYISLSIRVIQKMNVNIFGMLLQAISIVVSFLHDTSREWNSGMQIEWNEGAAMKRNGIKMLKICFWCHL